MIGLLVGAALMGIIIAVMEEDEFPGWGRMILWPVRKKMSHFLVEQFRDAASKEEPAHEFWTPCHRL